MIDLLALKSRNRLDIKEVAENVAKNAKVIIIAPAASVLEFLADIKRGFPFAASLLSGPRLLVFASDLYYFDSIMFDIVAAVNRRLGSSCIKLNCVCNIWIQPVILLRIYASLLDVCISIKSLVEQPRVRLYEIGADCGPSAQLCVFYFERE